MNQLAVSTAIATKRISQRVPSGVIGYCVGLAATKPRSAMHDAIVSDLIRA